MTMYIVRETREHAIEAEDVEHAREIVKSGLGGFYAQTIEVELVPEMDVLNAY